MNNSKTNQEYIDQMAALGPVFWRNDKMMPAKEAFKNIPYTLDDVLDAQSRLLRFSKYIEKAYPETKKAKGIIESPLVEASNLKEGIKRIYGTDIKGKVFLKLDSHLPVAGSVKARGGVYEVLKHAEKLAVEHGLLSYDDDYSALCEPRFKEFFKAYSIAVGSTGNLGLSIGIAGADLGFNVHVHMSFDAKQWKKKLLKDKGVNVIEHNDDYSAAVRLGRQQAENDSRMHFVDDENSADLFLGYAVAALRLKVKLDEIKIKIDENQKLKVYLPCGIGGAPGGIAFGLKLVFGDSAECYFAEPTHAPCMALGLISGKHDEISVYDIGIDGKTQADGLAVSRASKFVGKIAQHIVSGCYTLTDEKMFELLSILSQYENINVEPSAAASLHGALLNADSENCVHLCWLTGGSMVPDEMMREFIQRGEGYLAKL